MLKVFSQLTYCLFTWKYVGITAQDYCVKGPVR